jgi:hypothetical protein
MKRILVLGAISIVGAIVVATLAGGYVYFFSPESATDVPSGKYVAPQVALKPLPDADALAERLPFSQNIYRKLRDDALAAYTKQHPVAHSYDVEARDTLKLASYLIIWDDYYGEGLWLVLDGHAKRLLSEGCQDQVWLSLQDIVWGPQAHSSSGAAVNEVNACANRLGASPYPAAFRLAAYRMALVNMIVAMNHPRRS